MDIHIVVERPEYMILSEQAAAKELQIGHYCTRIVRAHLAETRDENQELVALRELVGVQGIKIGALETTIADMTMEEKQPDADEADLQPETPSESEEL